jgi:hypothetical protein
VIKVIMVVSMNIMVVPIVVHMNIMVVPTVVYTDIMVASLVQSNLVPRGFGGLEVACWPLVPKFAGSHLAKAIGFLGEKKSSARFPSEEK